MHDVYTPIVELQVLLSAIFVFIGATVFFISSLISGHNIFRDISHQMGLLVSTIVGFMLFAFSPISFLVLAPDLFITDGRGSDLYLQIHREVQRHLFWPFILSAIGLGATFGALEAINARTLFLHWLRRNIRVEYPILSYEHSWDNFMLSLKKGGRIKIFLKNGRDQGPKYDGKLKSASIRQEAKEITLDCDGTYQLVDGADIACIEADSRSFNRHLDAVPHQAEAFYLAIGAMGLLFLVWSADSIAYYFTTFKFWHLSNLYHALYGVFLAVAIVFGVISLRVSLQDFQNPRSYLVLCPTIPSLLLLEAVVILYWALSEPFSPRMCSSEFWYYWTLRVIVVLALLALVFICWLVKKGRELDDELLSKLGDDDKPLSEEKKEHVRRVCQFIYLQMDLIQSRPTRWSEFSGKSLKTETNLTPEIGRALLESLHEAVESVVESNTFLWRKEYLRGEDFNIVLRLRRKLEKDMMKAIPTLTSKTSPRRKTAASRKPRDSRTSSRNAAGAGGDA